MLGALPAALPVNEIRALCVRVGRATWRAAWIGVEVQYVCVACVCVCMCVWEGVWVFERKCVLGLGTLVLGRLWGRMGLSAPAPKPAVPGQGGQRRQAGRGNRGVFIEPLL